MYTSEFSGTLVSKPSPTCTSAFPLASCRSGMLVTLCHNVLIHSNLFVVCRAEVVSLLLLGLCRACGTAVAQLHEGHSAVHTLLCQLTLSFTVADCYSRVCPEVRSYAVARES